MTNIRKRLRETARRGTWEYATVEAVNNSLVTVILQGGKKRLTNLSLVGEDVIAGDVVIVDFSAELPVVYKKDAVLEGEVELDLAIEDLAKNNEQFDRLNHGFHAGISDSNCYTKDMYHFSRGVPYQLPFGRFEPQWGNDYPSGWDTSNFIKYAPLYGQPWITIPITGRYLAHLYFDIDPYATFKADLPKGPMRMRLMDGTTPLMMVQTRTNEYSSYKYSTLNAFDILSLTVGDVLHIELYHEWDHLFMDNWAEDGIENNDYIIYCYGLYVEEGPNVVLQLIPGTEA